MKACLHMLSNIMSKDGKKMKKNGKDGHVANKRNCQDINP